MSPVAEFAGVYYPAKGVARNKKSRVAMLEGRKVDRSWVAGSGGTGRLGAAGQAKRPAKRSDDYACQIRKPTKDTVLKSYSDLGMAIINIADTIPLWFGSEQMRYRLMDAGWKVGLTEVCVGLEQLVKMEDLIIGNKSFPGVPLYHRPSKFARDIHAELNQKPKRPAKLTAAILLAAISRPDLPFTTGWLYRELQYRRIKTTEKCIQTRCNYLVRTGSMIVTIRGIGGKHAHRRTIYKLTAATQRRLIKERGAK